MLDDQIKTTIGDDRPLAETWYERGRRDERERCAKIADQVAAGLKNGGAINAARQIAGEIRARR